MRSTRRYGFTLAELACVVVIIGMLASIAVPRFSNSIALQRVESAARRIIVDFAVAQSLAKTTNTSVNVTIKPSTDSYVLVGIPHPDFPSREYETVLREEPYGASIDSVDFGGLDNMNYDVFGVPDNGGSIVIRVGSRVRTIVVDADTGKASVQ